MQISNFGRLKSENGHFWIDYFQVIGESLTSILRIWCALFWSSITTKSCCSPLQCLFCKLVQMSNFCLLKSEKGHFWIDYFQIWGKSLKSISRIWWALQRSSITTKKICSPMQCFFCKLVQMSNFCLLQSENGHFWIDYFQIIGKSLPSILRIWWALFWSSITTKSCCSPLQCLFCKLVLMSNFGRLKSENGHFWIDYFQVIGKSLSFILRIWWALFYSSITTKSCCSPLQCLFCKSVQISNFGLLKSENEHFWIDYFQIFGKSPKSNRRIWWVLFISSIPPKIFAPQYSAFSVNWCKCPILVG